MEFRFVAEGDPKISGTHRTCLQVTRQPAIVGRGDCIVAVSSECGSYQLPDRLKEHLRTGGCIEITIAAGGVEDRLICTGHKDMTFNDRDDLVVRKSRFVCGRTLGIMSNKSASDLSRELIRELENPGARVTITISSC